MPTIQRFLRRPSAFMPLMKTLFVLVCLVSWLGLTALSLTHHHDEDVKADACSICQVVQHQSVDGVPPETVTSIALLIWVLIQHGRLSLQSLRSTPLAFFRSRAPPTVFA